MPLLTSVRKDTPSPRKVKLPAGRPDLKAIRIRLIHRGWNMNELSRRATLTRPYVSQLVHGHRRARRAQERIAHTLGLPFAEAFLEAPR